MAQELTTRADACFSVQIQGATHHEETPPFGREKAPVGLGHFTVESDRNMIAPVLQSMVRRKLHSYLNKADFHNYRVMLNLQKVHYRGLPLDPIDDLVPGFESDTQDPAAFATEVFMYQNGFQSVDQRTDEGWTPICFAAVDGSPLIISHLLEMRANVDDRLENLGDYMSPESVKGLWCTYLNRNYSRQGM